jgi:hypothetical protein
MSTIHGPGRTDGCTLGQDTPENLVLEYYGPVKSNKVDLSNELCEAEEYTMGVLSGAAKCLKGEIDATVYKQWVLNLVDVGEIKPEYSGMSVIFNLRVPILVYTRYEHPPCILRGKYKINYSLDSDELAAIRRGRK